MKKVFSIIAVMVAAVMLFGACVFGSEEAAESMIHMDTEYGIIDLVRYEVHDDQLFLVYDYTNTTDETVTPNMQYYTKGYQDGIELSTGFSMDTPDDCISGSKEIRPGVTIRFCSVLELTSGSPVELESYPLMDFSRSTMAEYVVDLGVESPVSEAVPETEEAAAVPESSGSESLEARIADLEERIAALEERLSTLAA